MAPRTGFEALRPAPVGPRVLAGAFDLFILCALVLGLSLYPLLTSGILLPMWGVLAAVLAYSVVPLSAFRATLGMRLFGLELVGKEGHAANPGDLLFRELVGRGLFPAAFLFTLGTSFIASLLGAARFTMPVGAGLVLALASLGVVGLAIPGHLFALGRSGRTLADVLARTMVIARRPQTPPEDDEERAFLKSQAWRRRVGVALFQVGALGAGLFLPSLLTQHTEGTDSYAERLTRTKLEKDFAQSPTNEVLARELASAYRRAGRASDAEQVERRLEAALFEDVGCDRRKALKLGDRLNREGRHTPAVALVESFTERCGEWTRLSWVALTAHRRLGEHARAVEVSTRLIEERPEDSDFWWWRGQDHAELGNYEQAAADFHQSMVQRPNGFAASRYGRFAHEELGRACEAAFALRAWTSYAPDEEEQWVEGQLSRLSLAGNCASRRGRGTAKLRFSPSDASPRVAGRVQGQPARFAAYPPAAYTVLDSAFANTLKLDLSAAAEVTLKLGDRVVPARITQVEYLQLGRARAEKLTVAVVEELEDGVNAVIGVNFLWRFRARYSAEALELRPLEERAGLSAR